eukprot:scaffold49019_cov22-Tisochrysis_lutea.AAC.2
MVQASSSESPSCRNSISPCVIYPKLLKTAWMAPTPFKRTCSAVWYRLLVCIRRCTCSVTHIPAQPCGKNCWGASGAAPALSHSRTCAQPCGTGCWCITHTPAQPCGTGYWCASGAAPALLLPPPSVGHCGPEHSQQCRQQSL